MLMHVQRLKAAASVPTSECIFRLATQNGRT